ncbi:antibiotic biosynthesis monooxygenase [Reinekea forsetii]|nr:antibiotic biosynthesis monooxygenase [Reinekea forsetii]
MPKVRLTGHIMIPTQSLAAVLEHLSLHLALTRSEPGCLKFNVNQDENEPCKLLVEEVFIDSAAFEAHQCRTQNSAWYEITKDFDRHYRIINEV